MRPSLTASTAAAAILAAGLVIYVFSPASILSALAWASLGAFVGWLGSLVMRSDTQANILSDILAGGVGAICGLLLFGGGALTEGGPVERVLASILGAALLVVAAGIIRTITGPVTRSSSNKGRG